MKPHPVKAWIIAARLFALPWILVNTLLGVTVAGFEPAAWILSFVIVSLILMSSHFFNAWIDFVRGFDAVENGSKVKPYTAGNQVLPHGWLSLRTVKLSTFALLILAALLMYFAPKRIDTISLFVFGVFIAYAYSLWLKPKGYGEIGLFFGHGFATTSFAYSFVKPVDLTGIAAATLLGFIAGVVYTVDQMQDVETDFAKKVKNFAQMIVEANMRISQLWYFMVTGTYTLLIGFVVLGALPSGTLLTLFLLPVAHAVGVFLDYRFEKGVMLALLWIWLFPVLGSLGVLMGVM